jgi:hypothetical protein
VYTRKKGDERGIPDNLELVLFRRGKGERDEWKSEMKVRRDFEVKLLN